MAKKDGLTGIYNRIYFNEFYKILLKRVFDEDNSIAVAMLDIDHFKNINDTYGHLAGDAVIKYVADIDKKFAKKRLSDDKEKAKAEVAQIKEKAGLYFKQDHTHASKLGAQMNAQSFAKGLRANGSELAKYLKTKK